MVAGCLGAGTYGAPIKESFIMASLSLVAVIFIIFSIAFSIEL
jgi:hypothetical protein